MNADAIRDQVREKYATAARTAAAGRTGCCGPPADAVTDTSDGRRQATAVADAPGNEGQAVDADATCCGSGHSASTGFGAGLYPAEDLADLPATARQASLGCGNPLAVADLHPGETVLDLGSGGGGDVLLSARRVGPDGRVIGLDMTDEMLDLARRNAAEAGATNVEFQRGTIEQIPLPDASVDVAISNCVINLSADKPAVFAEMFRVLRPGGRVGITDVVADDALSPQQRAERGDWVGCVAGALSRSEYVEGLTAAGFSGVDVIFTHDVADGMYSAIVRATRP